MGFLSGVIMGHLKKKPGIITIFRTLGHYVHFLFLLSFNLAHLWLLFAPHCCRLNIIKKVQA